MSEDRIAKLGAKIEDLEGIRVDQISIIKGLRKRIAELEERIAHVEEARKIQGSKGNWDMDEYMRGMYNSLEFAMCCLEDRDPVYKDPPESEGGADE